MSHTFRGEQHTRIHYNSDLSGMATVVRADGEELRVPAGDLAEFSAVAVEECERIAEWMETRNFSARVEAKRPGTLSACLAMRSHYVVALEEAAQEIREGAHTRESKTEEES